jgi:hypothetical protein
MESILVVVGRASGSVRLNATGGQSWSGASGHRDTSCGACDPCGDDRRTPEETTSAYHPPAGTAEGVEGQVPHCFQTN